MRKTTFVLAGDSFITQRLPHDAALRALRRYLRGFNVRFTNFEILLHDFEVYPAPVSGGTWAAARPSVLEDLKYLGFNLYTWANNHTIDWNIGGLLTTMRHLDAAGVIHAGVGRNLAEASQPKYLDTPDARVAIIGVTSTINQWGIAGAQRPDVLGRPGVNPLRYQTTHYLEENDLRRLSQIVEQTDVNADRQLNEKEGFAKASGDGCFVGSIRFSVGKPGTSTVMDEKDKARLTASIKEASRQADIVLVSHHTHERKGMDKELPADFARDFARLCLDNGAAAYIGHGPHIWRGIEIYNGKPIFYSLGDFIFQNDTVERQPTEFYDLYDLGPDNSVADGIDLRSDYGKRGLDADKRVFQSALASFAIEGGKISDITLKPISLSFIEDRGLRGRPSFAGEEEATEILEHIKALSSPYGTQIDIVNGEGIIKLS